MQTAVDSLGKEVGRGERKGKGRGKGRRQVYYCLGEKCTVGLDPLLCELLKLGRMVKLYVFTAVV